MADPQFIRELVERARESLAIELKAWFDPNGPNGQAKIVRCLLAMRNNGGGFMLIGFDNDTGQPLPFDGTFDIRAAFHIDRIQGLVTRFSSESFEVAVHFVERDGQDFPVIEVPSGIRTPVASKSSLLDAQNQPLIRDNRVFMRTVDSNGTPSSSEATWKDWSRIIETCFDSREADIGRFVRRHLSGLSEKSVHEISANLQRATERHETQDDALQRILDAGAARFRTVVRQHRQRLGELPQHGSWEVAAKLHGDMPKQKANL